MKKNEVDGWNKKKLYREWKVYVDGRLYEISHTTERKDYIVAMLSKIYNNVEAVPYNHYERGHAAKELERKIENQNKDFSKW